MGLLYGHCHRLHRLLNHPVLLLRSPRRVLTYVDVSAVCCGAACFDSSLVESLLWRYVDVYNEPLFPYLEFTSWL